MMLEIEHIEKPLRELSLALVASKVTQLNASINSPFIVLADRTKFWVDSFSKQMPWLVKTEENLREFKQRIDNIGRIENLYLNIREAHGRTPSGYIMDIRVTIPDANREVEYSVYEAFRQLLAASSPLLFDLHIIKLKGRKAAEVVPIGYWRYGWTSDYIC